LVPLVSAAWAEQLPTVVFSARDGLHTTVPRIVVDSKGFVWLPGSEGLARFDGHGFRIFTPAEGLPASIPSDIFERRDGTYWIAAQEHLCLFDPRPSRQRFQCESPKLGAIRRLLEDEQGLWCGTETGLWLRKKSWERVSAIQPTAAGRSIAVRGLLKDTRGDVWAATYSGLYRFRLNGQVDRWTHAQGLATDFITTVSETPEAIWAGTQMDLTRFRIDPHTGEARIAARYNRSHGLSSNIFAVHSWRGSVWAATSQGLVRQQPSGRWEAVGLDPSLSGFSLESLATDPLGNLWVGTDGGGAARISSSAISSFSERDGLVIRKVSAIFEDRNGDLMAVTKDEDHYALNRFDGYRFHSIQPKAPIGMAWGMGWSQIAVQSRSGDWWLATGSGLLRYPHHLAKASQIGLAKRNIFRVFEDSRGALWTSAYDISNHGLYRRDPETGRFESLDESPGLPSLHQHENLPSAFAEDRNGQLWIGMLDRGLVRYRNGRFQRLPPSSGAPDQGVRALLVDRQGRLWVAARRRGLLRVDDPSAAHPAFFTYNRSSGLSDNTILALAEDLAGNIYAASGRGIDRLDPATGRIRRFTTADGLPPGELRVAFRDRRGALWFGGDQGLVRIEPQQDRADAPTVLVHSIRVNGEPQPISAMGDVEPAELSLSPSQREVQVDFGGFRHDLHYQTRLIGVNRDWTPPSASRSAHYLSLASGSYELLIRAVAPEGSVSPRPARVRFRIAAPVWQRWWFLLLSAAAVAAIVYVAHRYRVAQAVALERVRTRIASDLHDDIGSSLSQIAVLSEVVRLRVDARDPQMAASLSRIADISRELIDSMSDIVWAINPHKDRLRDLTQRMRRFAGELLEARDIRWDLHTPDQSADLPLDPDTRREVFLIFKESIHNLVRHSGCSEAEVQLHVKDGELVLEVRDNGRGLETSGSGGGHGLASMRARAKRLRGSLDVVSSGAGATVLLRVPLR
jgi:ligand-binding sensor domain-containing protein/signal transduction histidine kinase